MDTIRTNMQAGPKPAQPGISQTAQVQQLLQAKSGKAVGPTAAPGISNIGEKVAAQQAQIAEQQVQQQGMLQGQAIQQQASEQAQQAQIQGRQLDERTLDQMDEFTRNHNAILDDYNRGIKQLDLNKDKSKLEQIGFNLRLNNDKYVTDLQREGRRSRLDNEIKFNEELTRTIFADEEDLLRNDLNFRALIGANDRDFREEIGNISISHALDIADTEAKAANSQMMWQGIGAMTSAGIKGYESYSAGSFDSGYQDYQGAGGKASYSKYSEATPEQQQSATSYYKSKGL